MEIESLLRAMKGAVSPTITVVSGRCLYGTMSLPISVSPITTLSSPISSSSSGLITTRLKSTCLPSERVTVNVVEPTLFATISNLAKT